MGLIAATAFILLTQSASSTTKQELTSIDSTARKVLEASVSQDRLDEIWGHIDNRVITQLDTWFERGEFPPSASLLKVQFAYTPDDYETMTDLGWMLENIDKMGEAREVYKEYSDMHPKDGNAIFPLAMTYYMKKDFQTAIKYLEPSLVNNPGPNSYRVLARCYEREKKLADAIRIWELELKRWPGELTATANIKRVKAKMNSGGGKAKK